MKKYLLLILLMLPVFVFAECSYTKHEEFGSFASRITYETDYNMSDNTFTLTFYNVIDGLYFKIGETGLYKPDSNDTIVLSGLSEGSSMNVYDYANDDCMTQVRTIGISLPYYNPYYGSLLCSGYENLVLCSSRFTNMKATEELIKKMKENYDANLIQDAEAKEEEKEKEFNLGSFLWDIFVKYISKALLVIVSSGVTILYFNNKMIKVEHGV